MQNTRDPLGFTHDLDRLTINLEDLPQAHLAQAEAYQRVRAQIRERDIEIANLKQLIQKFDQKASDQADNILSISSIRQFDHVNFGMKILILEAKLDGKDIQLAMMEGDLKETEVDLDKTKKELQKVKKELESEDTHARIVESHLLRAIQEKFSLAAEVKALNSVQKENEEQREKVSLLTENLESEREESNRLNMKVKAMRDVHKDNMELHERLRTLTKAIQEEHEETAKLKEENKALLALQTQFTEALELDNEEETSHLRAKLTESKTLYSQLQSKHQDLVGQLQETKGVNSELKDKLANSEEELSKLQDTVQVYVCQVSKGSIQHDEDKMRLLELEDKVKLHEIITKQLRFSSEDNANKLSQACSAYKRKAAAHSALQEKNTALLRDVIAHEETISALQMEATKAEQKIKWYGTHQDSGMLANIDLHQKFTFLAAQLESLTAICNTQTEEITANHNTISTMHDNSVANKEDQAEETSRLMDQVQELENAVCKSTADAEKERQAAESRNEEKVEEIKGLRSQVQELEDAAIDTKRDMESNLSYLEQEVLDIAKARDLHIDQSRLYGDKIEKLNEELANVKDSGCQLTQQLIQRTEAITSLKNALTNAHEENAVLGTRNVTLERMVSNLKFKLQQKVEESHAQTARLEKEKAALEHEFTAAKLRLEKSLDKTKAYADLVDDDNSLLKLRLGRVDKERRDRIQKENQWNAMVQSELDKIKVSLRAENNAYKERVAKLEARYEDRSWEFEGSDLDPVEEGAGDVRGDQLQGVKKEGGSDDDVSSGPEVESASDDDEESGPEVESVSDDDESDMELESGSANSVA